MQKDDKSKKYTYILNQEYAKEIQDVYWENVVQTQVIEKPLKIRSKENNFIMLLHMSEQIYLNLLKKLWWKRKLWFAYLWYLQILINTIDFSNKIDFNTYRSYWVSFAMIKTIRRKFKKNWIVKNIGRDFYINPSIARKWQEIPMYVIELFK